MTCPHHPGQIIRQHPEAAPMPCQACRGWVGKGGLVMDRRTTLARYPDYARFMGGPGQPDGGTTADRLIGAGQTMGAVGGWFIRLVFWLVVLGVIVWIGVAALQAR